MEENWRKGSGVEKREGERGEREREGREREVV